MNRETKILMIELSAPRGPVFSAVADAVEMETGEGVIAINPREESYFNLTQTTRVTLRVGAKFHTFVLTNAAASLREGHLTVVAEEILHVFPAAVPAASTSGRVSP